MKQGHVLERVKSWGQKPYMLLIIVGLAVFAADQLSMPLRSFLATLPEPLRALVESILVSAFAFPALYLFLIRPMAMQIETLNELEQELRRSRDELELRVQQRTAELARTVGRLESEIQERQRAECRSDVIRTLLELFARKTLRQDYLNSVVGVIQSWSGCHAVGIRIVDQRQNLPYAASVGLSREFQETDNSLSLKEDTCACTRVVLGTPSAPDRAAMTPRGSFRLDNVIDFIKQLPAADKAQFRSDCVRCGFSALAVIPIRCREQVLGAIHLADERPGVASADCVEFIESMGLLIGEAIQRFNIEDELRQNYHALAQRTIQLRWLAAELTQAEERERRRLAQVLHDHLQQLLVGAKFSLDVLRRQREANSIVKAVNQVDDLLAEAIKVSRSLTYELSPPILYEAGLASALEWLGRWMQEEYGLHVQVDAEAQANPEAEDVSVLLFQAVRELLFNVVRHAQVKTAQVKLSRLAEDRTGIQVSDQGIGFDPARLKTGDPTGSGFGLFNIRERLDLIGGQFEIQSAPGQGSRLILSAPLRPPPSSEPNAPMRPAPSRLSPAVPGENPQLHPSVPLGRKIRILLADDHALMRQGLARLLQEETDFEVVGEASNGREAVELARKLRPDVVLMDVGMPELNGIEATRQLRTELPQTGVIGLSMYEEGDWATSMHAAGAAAYLTKGGPSEALIATIRACVMK